MKIKVEFKLSIPNQEYDEWELRELIESKLGYTGLLTDNNSFINQEVSLLLEKIELDIESNSSCPTNENETIFDTPEKIEEGALLLARIRQIPEDRLVSKQLKRLEYLIKRTGFNLNYNG